MENFSSRDLYLIKPSIVVNDYNENRIIDNKTLHKISLERRLEDISVAYKLKNKYIDVFNNKEYNYVFKHLKNANVGELYIGVTYQDIINFVEFAYTLYTKNKIWNDKIKDYLIELKPFYTKEEINSVLNDAIVKERTRRYTLSNRI